MLLALDNEFFENQFDKFKSILPDEEYSLKSIISTIPASKSLIEPFFDLELLHLLIPTIPLSELSLLNSRGFDIRINIGHEKSQSLFNPDSLHLDNEGAFDLLFNVGFSILVEEYGVWVAIREGYFTISTKFYFDIDNDQIRYESISRFEDVMINKDGEQMEEDEQLIMDLFEI